MPIVVIDGMNENDRSGSHLLSQIELNYAAAQNFYLQKKMAFLKAIVGDAKIKYEQMEDALIASMNNLIQEQWSKINEAVLSGVNISNHRTGRYTVSDVSSVDIPKELRDRIIAQSGNGNIYSMLGLYYEEWLYNNLANAAFDVGDSNTNMLLNEFFHQFEHTGSVRSHSAMRNGFLEIRPDLAVGIDKETAASKSNPNLKAELQVAFNIQNYRNKNGLNDLESVQNDTNLLADYINSDMFGFSVKRWTEGAWSKSKSLTSASGVASIVNSRFSESGEATWNALYAYRTMMHIVSSYLLDILGPVNVAFITGSSIEWTDQFLSDALLSMNVYSKRQCANNEIYHPYTNSGNIYVQHYARGRQQALESIKFSSSKHMTGKGWSAYQMRFTIN